jgi:hypothetical protein
MPCAIKVSRPGLRHKSAVKAMATDIGDLDEVRRSAARLLTVARTLGGGVLLVERMVPAGGEILVAARADGVVPVLVAGMGGRWAEVLGDVVVVPLPAEHSRVLEALQQLRGAALLPDGLALSSAAALAARLGALLLQRRWRMVELNPVVVATTGAVAVDAVLVPGTLDDLPDRVLP